MSFNFPGARDRSSTSTEERRRPGGVLIPTIVILGVIVVGFVIFTGFYTDFLWFDSVDKATVFTVQLITKVLLFVVFGGLMTVSLLLVMWWSWKSRPEFRAMTPEQASLDRYREAIDPYRGRLAIGLAIVMGLFAGLAASSEWDTYLQFRNSTDFG
ncbi:MAG: UPF0182 family protein, partial [Actinomycetota bacterium]|nr:UPF0182 family protein [Actinomycetota bacterium]